MRELPLVIVVCGYGCHLDSPLGDVYLPRAVEYIKKLPVEPRGVILCGGKTQKGSAGDISEAEVMYRFIIQKTGGYVAPFLFKEEDSMTTLENIGNAAIRMVSLVMPGSARVVIFCEATRSANVVMLARHFMIREFGVVESIDDITVETASWERADPFKQAGNLIHNKLAITFPWLGLAGREHRRRHRRSFRI